MGTSTFPFRAPQISNHYHRHILNPLLQKVLCNQIDSCAHIIIISTITDPVHSNVSHGCDDSLPPPVMLPKARHLIGHPPQDSRYPVEASQYHRIEADGMASLVDIPFDPNLQCPICQRMFRKGEIQLYRQHVELCKNNSG